MGTGKVYEYIWYGVRIAEITCHCTESSAATICIESDCNDAMTH